MRTLMLMVACLAVITPCLASSLVVTLANPGFEEIIPGNDAPGWGWYTRARASFHTETRDPHSGARCLVFSNESDLQPEVYGRLYQFIGVLPGVEYELSAWVRGEEVASAIHFTDWNSYTLNIPTGSFGWQKIATTFRTKNDQNMLNLGINIVNRCKELAIDDLSLRPVGTPFKGEGVIGSLLVPGRVTGDDAPAFLGLLIEVEFDGSVEAEIKGGSQVLLSKRSPIKIGENAIELDWTSGKVAVRDLSCTINVLDAGGKLRATASQKIEKLGSELSAQLGRVQARLPEFDALYEKCRARGIPLDYPNVTRTMLRQFLPLAREDLQKGELVRTDYAVKDFNRSLDQAMAEMRVYLKAPQRAPVARRYRTSKLEIDGVSFLADRQNAKGKKDRGPVFYCGFGHFGQVRKDIPRFPGYGVNIIQIEVGPAITMPTEHEISLDAAKDIVKVLDRAAANHVMVNVLLSPHYFPPWAMAKWPHLASGGGGFLGYCVDTPEAKQVIEKFLRTVVPLFRGKPALHSFCLSNEPLFDRNANCPNTKTMWAEYLARVHGDVATMNQRYGTEYADFTAVPIPGNDQYSALQYYDYARFNQERFAAWHKWMADIIHELAPEIPVHAKVMAWTFHQRWVTHFGTDPEMFGALSQINGNDCAVWAGQGGGPWAIAWHSQNLAYDLQRSLNRKPIFNSENHLTPDRSTFYVAPEHFRTALWQGALHGQGATTIWVWERTYNRNYDFYGNVMDRPGCAEAVGRTCLDLNRFAEEVTALQNKPAPVAIVYSMSSIARDGAYLDMMGRAYEALNFCGVKADFISEKQLVAGDGNKYRMIVLPNATHLREDAYRAMGNLPASTRLVVLGEPPSKDPYGHPLSGVDVSARTALTLSAKDNSATIWPQLLGLLSKLGVRPQVSVVDAKTGQPVWGVEWLPAKVGNRTVINMVNLTTTPVEVKIVSMGGGQVLSTHPLQARDLLSIGGTAQVGQLLPMTPVLAEVKD